ncbi:sorbin/SH3 domain protein [Perilla frutescens var. frutescens]|nr:sorbin/SH3 domain protein [Perilla frutescens var. frutescens]
MGLVVYIAPWLSVPHFGDWDQNGVIADHSMDFSKIREMRKQNKTDPSRASVGNEEELVSSRRSTSSAQCSQRSPQLPRPSNSTPPLVPLQHCSLLFMSFPFTLIAGTCSRYSLVASIKD